MRGFLRAEWKNLILLNYRVPDSVLASYLPEGCELDRFEGSAYVSLVAFQFLKTRVLGIPWPGFVNFPEINLRFYVRHGGERGVCFVREFVPSRIVAGIARLVYNEPYSSAGMSHSVEKTDGVIHARYTAARGDAKLAIECQALDEPSTPSAESREHFFKEHELGVGRDRAGRLLTYRVSHPVWRVFPIQKVTARLNWATLYAPDFEILQGRDPDSACFAEGSEIAVMMKGRSLR